MIGQDEKYRQYLAQVSAALTVAGAQTIFSGETSPFETRAPWLDGWDRIFAHQQPGSNAVYAITNGEGASLDQLRERIDSLVQGLSGRQSSSALPLKVISVVVYASGVDRDRTRRVSRLMPRTYIPGLRPTAWVADLPNHKIHGGRLFRSEERRVLEQATLAAAEPLSGHELEALGSLQAERGVAFYRLMRSRQPFVTFGLIAVNVVAFLLLLQNGGPSNVQTLLNFGALSPILVEHGQWWRAFTSIFLHASVPHILFNMVSLFAVGTLAERLYGSLKFLAIYLGAGLIGSGASLFYATVSGQLNEVGVGASGAIFGVAGALLMVRFQHSDVIPQRVRNQVSSSLLPLVALSLIFAFLTPHVDNAAHVGGLLGGMALSFAFPLVRRLPETV